MMKYFPFLQMYLLINKDVEHGCFLLNYHLHFGKLNDSDRYETPLNLNDLQ